MTLVTRVLFLNSALVLLVGCTLNANVEPPQPHIPNGWEYAASLEQELPSKWWLGFSSTELNSLVSQALQQNLELSAASARLRLAEAQLTIAGAELWPSVGVSASAQRNGEFSGGLSSKSYKGTLAASYEIDLFGSTRANQQAAQANYFATEFDQDTIRTSVVSAVVNTYLDLLALRQRITLTEDNLSNSEQVLQVVETRQRFGAGSTLEVAQQKAQLAGQRAALPPLQQQERERRAALAVLVGQTPQQFRVASRQLSLITQPLVTATYPAQVLARRPDVRRADATLKGAEADIVAARAALFPSLSVGTSLDWQSNQSTRLLAKDPFWSITGAVTQALFQGGRLRAQTEVARARYDELAATYVQTVLTALAEADVALANVQALISQGQWQRQQAHYADLAYEQAKTRYNTGSVDLLTVLDSQRTLLSAQDGVLQNKLAQLQARVALYRVLGAVPAEEDRQEKF